MDGWTFEDQRRRLFFSLSKFGLNLWLDIEPCDSEAGKFCRKGQTVNNLRTTSNNPSAVVFFFFQWKGCHLGLFPWKCQDLDWRCAIWDSASRCYDTQLRSTRKRPRLTELLWFLWVACLLYCHSAYKHFCSFCQLCTFPFWYQCVCGSGCMRHSIKPLSPRHIVSEAAGVRCRVTVPTHMAAPLIKAIPCLSWEGNTWIRERFAT